MIFTCILILSVSCSSDKKTDSIKQQSDTIETDRTKKSASSDFFSNRPEMELIVSSSRTNYTFDFDEAIELTVELYSPIYSTYQTYKKTIGSKEPAVDFGGLVIGSDDNPWSDNLTLLVVSNNVEKAVPFVFTTTQGQNQLKLGEGDIGLLHLLIAPGHFSQADSLILRLKYVESDRNIDLAGETMVLLQSGIAGEQQKNLSTIHFLIASGKNNDALTLAQEAVKAQPESYNARVLLGKTYEKTGELSEALTAYEKGLSLFKDEGIGHVPEAPKGLWLKIKELRAKLEEQ